jgi:hypothetical protein
VNDLSVLKEIPDPLADAPARAESPAPLPRFLGAAPVRRETRGRRAAALAVSLAWLCTHLAVYGVRPDFARLPAEYIAVQIALPALLGACSLLLAVAPGKLGLGLNVGIVTSLAVLGPLSFWLLALAVRARAAALSDGNFWLGSLVCLDITLAWAAAPLLLAALTLRRAFPALAGWRSALVGAALGLLSGAAINLHCPNVDPAHMLAGHGVPVVVAALVGGLLVSRWARA